MKKKILAVGVWLAAGSALAQFMGLPLAGGAQAPVTGETRGSAGAVMGDEFNLYGGRLTFAPVQPLAIFADLGAFDPDAGDVGWAVQLGGQFTLPLKESVLDVALRGVWDRADYDLDAGEATSSGFNVGVLVSRSVEFLTPYAYAGLNFVDTEVDIKGRGKHTDDSTDLALAIGALVHLGGPLSLYAEVAYVDDAFVGIGGRWQF